MYKILDVVKKENGRIDYYVISNSKGQKKNISKSDLIVLIDEGKVSNGVVYRYGKQTIINITNKKQEYSSPLPNEKFLIGYDIAEGQYYKIGLISHIMVNTTEKEIKTLMSKNKAMGVEVDSDGELLTGGLISLFSDDYILYYDELSYKNMPPIYRKDGDRNITISNKNTEYLLYFGYYRDTFSPCTVYIISRSGKYLNIAAPLLFTEASTGGRKYNIVQNKGIWYNYCNYTSHLYYTGATVHHTDVNFGLSIEKSVLKYYKSHDKSSETIESIKLKELNKLLKENGGWFIK